ncbi:MAG: TonB family protein [Vulcanimicrobiaceae bacterium]
MQSACAAAITALSHAQAAWRAFHNGDFVRAPEAAEAQLRNAKAALASADRNGAACRGDKTALPRVEVHFEIDLVDARRSGGKTATLQVLANDLKTMRDLGLAGEQPARYQFDVERFREVQAETRGTLILPAPPAGSVPPVRAGCAQPDSQPSPLAPIVPGVPNPAFLRRPHGATAVTVLVGPTGNVLSTFTTASSGNPALDQAVENAARLVTFAPARANCKPVEGDYRFTYTFPQI